MYYLEYKLYTIEELASFIGDSMINGNSISIGTKDYHKHNLWSSLYQLPSIVKQIIF